MKWWIPVVIFFVVAIIAIFVAIALMNRAHCDGGLYRCAGTCVNLFTDPKNCGKCGNNCGVDETTSIPKVCVNEFCQNAP